METQDFSFEIKSLDEGGLIEGVASAYGNVDLQGDIVAFDLFCMLLERERQVQLVYKHAISTVQPNGPINLSDNGDEDGDA